MLDTGNLVGDIIDRSFFYDRIYRHNRKKDIPCVPCYRRARLADGHTVMVIREKFWLTLEFKLDDKIYSYSGYFYVLPTSQPFILSLATMMCSCYDLFEHAFRRLRMSFLEDAPFSADDTSPTVAETAPYDPRCLLEDLDFISPFDDENTEHPWSRQFAFRTIEDDMIPDVSFVMSDLFSFADEYSARCDQYQVDTDAKMADIRENNPQFLVEVPEFEEFLRSDYCRDVFVKEKWEGLKDPATGKVKIFYIPWTGTPPPKRCSANKISHPDILKWLQGEISMFQDMGYLAPSTSPTACAMHVVPKGQFPWYRQVTNYIPVNKYMEIPAYPIPDIRASLNKITRGNCNGEKFTLFAEFDGLSMFHQLRVDDVSSDLLSMVCSAGQFKPLFLPEGIPPASAILQKAVTEIFHPLEDCMIVLFDNFLLLATSPRDMFEKFKRIVEICRAANLVLKQKKCNYALKQLLFFGYEVDQTGYRISDDRIVAIQKLPFPGDVEGTPKAKRAAMQSYLGFGGFVSPFVGDYTSVSAPLFDMTAKDFDWTPESWQRDFRADFDKHKAAIAGAVRLNFPDYSLRWILRTDASRTGCAAVLYQIRPVLDADGNPSGETFEPLACISHKMSDPATRWHAMHLEAFGIFWAVKHLRHLLRGKEFVLESDHRNLVWMEQSDDDKVLRMAVYLAGFIFRVRHLKGKLNTIADFLSRMFPKAKRAVCEAAALAMLEDPDDFFYLGDFLTFDDEVGWRWPEAEDWLCAIEPFDAVHGGREGHPGVKRTWMKLNRYFPGHGLSVKEVASKIDDCLTCQKVRGHPKLHHGIAPLVKHLPVTHSRGLLGMDVMEVAPATSGALYLLVIYNVFTKYVALFPMPNKEAITVARCMFTYLQRFGLHDCVHSDLGSEFTATIMEELVNKWLGIRRTFALRDNPQADGVEPIVGIVLRHIQTLVLDERLTGVWDVPENLGWVELVVNETPKDDSGISPLQLMFGATDARRFQWPQIDSDSITSDYLREMSDLLEHLRQRSRDFQLKLKAERKAAQPEVVNRFQPGDFVLLHLRDKRDKLDKTKAINVGPFRVVAHPEGSNHVQVKSLLQDTCVTYNSPDLIIYTGTEEQAKQAAMADKDHFQVRRILGYMGNPLVRSTLSFEVEFCDGDVKTLLYADVARSEALDQLVATTRFTPLLMLNFSASDALARLRQLDRAPIPHAVLGQAFFLNMRHWSLWYNTPGKHSLPNPSSVNYFIPASLHTAHCPRKRHGAASGQVLVTRTFLICPTYGIGVGPGLVENVVGGQFIFLYCNVTQLQPTDVLLTPALLQEYKCM